MDYKNNPSPNLEPSSATQTRIDFASRLERIMQAFDAKSDSELARNLDIKPQSVAAARQRLQIPSGWIEKTSVLAKVSTDWLFFGHGSMRYTGKSTPSEEGNGTLDPLRLKTSISVVEQGLADIHRTMNPEKKANLIIAVYDFLSEDNEVDSGRIIKFIKAVA